MLVLAIVTRVGAKRRRHTDTTTASNNLLPRRQQWEQRREERMLQQVGSGASCWKGSGIWTVEEMRRCRQYNAACFMRVVLCKLVGVLHENDFSLCFARCWMLSQADACCFSFMGLFLGSDPLFCTKYGQRNGAPPFLLVNTAHSLHAPT